MLMSLEEMKFLEKWIDSKYRLGLLFHAFDFLLFCQRNPKPCPLLDVTEPGSIIPRKIAKEADIRKDILRYRIYRNGVNTEEVMDITEYWEDDMVGFLLGCSFTFETPLLESGIPIRHIEKNVMFQCIKRLFNVKKQVYLKVQPLSVCFRCRMI
jgi:uncharacterized protein YcsI (UPF0317 family)